MRHRFSRACWSAPGVGIQRAHVVAQRQLQGDLPADHGTDQFDQIADHGVGVGASALDGAAAAEAQKLAGEGRRPLGRLVNLLQVARSVPPRGPAPPWRAGVAVDDLQEVVELVGDSAGQLSHALQLLRLPQRLFGVMVHDDLGGRFGQMREEGVVFLGNRVFGEHGQHAGRVAARVVQLVAREGYQPQRSGPLVIVHVGIGGDVVAEELLLLAGGDPADLVATQGHAAVIAVGVGVASGAGHQVQALVAATAEVRFVGRRGVDAARIAQVPRCHAPDAAKVQVQQVHGRVGDLLELFVQRRRQDQLFLEPVESRHNATRSGSVPRRPTWTP